MVKLSILVASIIGRNCAPLLEKLQTQLDDLPVEYIPLVEILAFTDNRRRTVGAKRNDMLLLAHGEYVACVDDDDRVSDDYILQLIGAIHEHPDCDCYSFNASVSIDRNQPRLCRYSTLNHSDYNTAITYERRPNHICCVKSSLSAKAGFIDMTFGEDSDYASRLYPLIKSEYHIDKTLYFYDYLSAESATQKVDVVIASYAIDESHRKMTEETIKSCISTAGTKIHVIVMEQQPGIKYPGTETINWTGKFCYNAVLNAGASHGTSEWIVFCNSDLLFKPKWLLNLLEVSHPVMSPLNPGDPRQLNIYSNSIGQTNGTHFSGWCFMMRRDIWNQIGGLGTCVNFSCSDDVVIQQILKIGISPMLVPESKVQHLRSKTAGAIREDVMTWEDVELFNQRFQASKFIGDPRFNEWKRLNGK